MINPYTYTFYRIYKKQRTKFGEIESVFASLLGLSCLLFLNIFSILKIFEKVNILSIDLITKPIAIFIMVILIMFNCVFFYSKKKYLKIEMHFNNIRKIPFGLGWILIYSALTIIIFLYVPFF